MIEKIDELNYLLLKKSLNASAERGRVIAHNIANVNTKGFKASRVVFEDKLKDAIENANVGLKTTHDKHINDGSSISTLSHDVIKDKSTSMRLDGNNVDIDNEMANLAANNILYNALISQANSRISVRRYVISEGRR
ncbi:flagellar basal body rod protein FlgB [Fervidicella metallireducens AeB]|uniref:Flagellar basal body rod protein FlgB n=1 Tax=Fervidicella metallireducens AeB TaxID=1403537 RepID=A0A017RVZ7_9CLOT|nr:flagellar basal body rod protein FlgB [Fervidicella metallireducens]EYE88796.1 flagellar basal body rod protein FlgB [Fervidicella metallireducens AeB]